MNKPNYSFDFELFCGVIEYNNKKYYMDINDQYSIINYPKNFTFQNDTDLYPTYNYNEQKINYLLFLYNHLTSVCFFQSSLTLDDLFVALPRDI